MITLIPEEVNFKISTTDILVKYVERDVTEISIDVLTLKNFFQNLYTEYTIQFKDVAEVKCISLNFFEHNYDNHTIFKIDETKSDIDFWKEFGYSPDSGFYQIDNSEYLKERKNIYDPKNRLNLKHYLVIGNDSYIEVLASSYT
ncbi:hypothetical protein C3B47_14075 [Flavobacterium columnare]|uniref:hypothetical protein n=1 Tax=Flavobacterium columnare TaxID=996 RepID=UPI0018967AC0|nr:hypothetical protein [Flavobacterium columnare]MBF6653982.1 hypothetical protein [Flavobacterium columnare]